MEQQMPVRLYDAGDMAKVYCAKCEGCGKCCHGMTDTIHLDPYDVDMLTKGLGKTFEQLMGSTIALHNEAGLVLPHLRMEDGENGACPFLGADGRCTIHAIRPGYCRLFPLGRDYSQETHTFRYFVTDNGCDMPGKMKVRISKWLGIPDLPRYEKFVTNWHYYIKDVKKVMEGSDDAAFRESLNMFLLKVFYETPYDEKEGFYYWFDKRLEKARSVL